MLTASQKNFASKNHNLIYRFALDHRLSLPDYYDLLAIGLCKAAGDFDPSLGYSFSTLAYAYMKNECKYYWRHITNKRHIPHDKISSLEEPICSPEGNLTLMDSFRNSVSQSYSFDPTIAETNAFIGTLTPKQKCVISGLINGFLPSDIAEKACCSRQNISRVRSVIQKKWRLYDTK